MAESSEKWAFCNPVNFILGKSEMFMNFILGKFEIKRHFILGKFEIT